MPIPAPSVVAVLSEKGGVGKTTCAVHLAGYACLRGISSILLDCNAEQGSATRWAQRHPEGSQLAGLQCVPVRGRLTLPLVERLAGGAQLVVIDGMPYLGREAEHAAACADAVLIPLRPGQYDLDSAEQTRGALDRAEGIRAALRRPPMKRLVVLTQGFAQRRREREALDLLGATGWGELVGVLRFREAFADTAAGGTVYELAPGSAAAKEAEELAKTMLRVLGLGRGRR